MSDDDDVRLPIDLPAANIKGEPYTTKAILVGRCAGCNATCLALENHGMMRCTHCGEAVRWQWATARLHFSAQGEALYLGWDRGKNAAAARRGRDGSDDGERGGG